jgi:hypothetical protein
MEDPDLARARAETLFKRKEKHEKQRVEGRQAMAEYVAEKHAMREKTVRLRALRLARYAATAQSRKRAGKDLSAQNRYICTSRGLADVSQGRARR